MKVGILGFAHGHVNGYCGRWREDPAMDIQVVAGWDHDQERLTKAVENYGLDPANSADELLAQDIEGVIIASETLYHADLVVKAAEAGKAIVLQKPIALTSRTPIASSMRSTRAAYLSPWPGRCVSIRRTWK